MKVPFVDFTKMHGEIRQKLDEAYNKVLDKNMYIQGEECERFEKAFAEYCGAKYCIGVATGLDALYLILKAVGIGAGDEVIVPSNTFIASLYLCADINLSAHLYETFFTISVNSALNSSLQ